MSVTAVFKGTSCDIPVSEHVTLGEVGAAVSNALNLDVSTLKLLSSKGALVPNATPQRLLATTCACSPPPPLTTSHVSTSMSRGAQACHLQHFARFVVQGLSPA